MADVSAKPQPKPLPTGLSLRDQYTMLVHPEWNLTHYVPFEDAGTFAFEPAATDVSRVNAWWLSDAAWASYIHDPTALKQVYGPTGIADVDLFEVHGTDFTVAHTPEFAIVAFRGTQPDQWRDIFADVHWKVRAWDTGFVHGGFADAFERGWLGGLRDALTALPSGCRIWVTGHSLGAAMATLAAWRIDTHFGQGRVAGVCTFGSPLVGNDDFAAQFPARFPGLRSRRYVNHVDLVTRVPPEEFAFPHGRFTHVETLRQFDAAGHLDAAARTQRRFFWSVFGNGAVMLDMLRLGAHVDLHLPQALRDHTPVHYPTLVWNDFVANYATA